MSIIVTIIVTIASILAILTITGYVQLRIIEHREQSMPTIDLTGQRFGHWDVLGMSSQRSGRAPMWDCRCDCGTERAVRGDNLRYGRSTGCGCSQRIQVEPLITEPPWDESDPDRTYGHWDDTGEWIWDELPPDTVDMIWPVLQAHAIEMGYATPRTAP